MDRVIVTMNLTAYDRDTYWAGMIEELGTYVYAKDLEELRVEADKTVDFLMSCFESTDEMVGYFNRRGINHALMQPHYGARPHRLSIQRNPPVPA